MFNLASLRAFAGTARHNLSCLAVAGSSFKSGVEGGTTFFDLHFFADHDILAPPPHELRGAQNI